MLGRCGGGANGVSMTWPFESYTGRVGVAAACAAGTRIAALAAERAEPVPRVVASDRDEERDGRREQVVDAEVPPEEREDCEVDRVAGRADDAELRELDPVRGTAKRRAGAVATSGESRC